MIHIDPESFSTSIRGEGGLPDPETVTDEKGGRVQGEPTAWK